MSAANPSFQPFRPFRPVRSLLVVACLYLAAPTPRAFGGSVEEAEHIRLTEEMRRLSKRNIWKGVDAAYEELLELRKKGVELTYEDHFLGAQAARGMGRINAVHRRLQRAVQSGGAEEVGEAEDWLQEIDANYGQVVLANKSRMPATLTPTKMPFAPDKRAAIEKAVALIEAEDAYEGLLPTGEYSYGTVTFTVGAGQDPAQYTLEKSRAPRGEREPFSFAYLGPRFTLGGVYTSAGADDSGSGGPSDAFFGLGPRGGVGLEAGLSHRFGVLLEMGYQGLLGGYSAYDDSDVQSWYAQGGGSGWNLYQGDEWTEQPLGDAGATAHIGYVWLAGLARVSNLALTLGPTWSIGLGKVSSLEEQCGESGCGVARFSGTLSMGGVGAGVGYDLFKLGSFQGAGAFYLGAQTDTARWYTWGQAGVTLSPAREGRDG